MHTSLPRDDNKEEAWLAEFRGALVRADLSPKTTAGYVGDVSRFSRWYEKELESPFSPERLVVEDLINYREQRKAQRLRPATINRHLEAIRRLCRWAMGEGLLKEDPSRQVQTVRTAKRLRPRGLHSSEVHKLLRAAGQSLHGNAARNRAVLDMLVNTGVRVAELAALRLGDVVVRERSGSVRVRHGRGNKEREVPLNASARRALRRYFATRDSLPPAAPLFESRRGGPMSVRALQYLVTEIGQRARIDRLAVTAHSLRHTFALSFIRDNPGKLLELQKLLGHDSLDTTAIYTRPSQDELAAAVEKSRLDVSR